MAQSDCRKLTTAVAEIRKESFRFLGSIYFGELKLALYDKGEIQKRMSELACYVERLGKWEGGRTQFLGELPESSQGFVRFSRCLPDGQILIYLENPSRFQLYDETLKLVDKIELPSRVMFDQNISGDGKYCLLAKGSSNDQKLLFSLEKREIIADLPDQVVSVSHIEGDKVCYNAIKNYTHFGMTYDMQSKQVVDERKEVYPPGSFEASDLDGRYVVEYQKKQKDLPSYLITDRVTMSQKEIQMPFNASTQMLLPNFALSQYGNWLAGFTTRGQIAIFNAKTGERTWTRKIFDDSQDVPEVAYQSVSLAFLAKDRILMAYWDGKRQKNYVYLIEEKN